MQVHASASVVDLGLDIAWRKRSVKKTRVRQAKADNKMKKVKRMASRPLRHKLAMAHYGRQALYAAEALCISTAKARKHRHMMATTLGWTPGCCALTVLAANSADLVADHRWKSVWLWMQLWRQQPQMRDQWRTTWVEASARRP